MTKEEIVEKLMEKWSLPKKCVEDIYDLTKAEVLAEVEPELGLVRRLKDDWLKSTKEHHPKHPCPEIVKCNRCLICFGNHWVSEINMYMEKKKELSALESQAEKKGE